MRTQPRRVFVLFLLSCIMFLLLFTLVSCTEDAPGSPMGPSVGEEASFTVDETVQGGPVKVDNPPPKP